MRNLVIDSVEQLETCLHSKISCMQISALSGIAIFATEKEVFSFSLEDKKVKNSIEVECDRILSIEYMFDDECVVIVTSNGDFFEWRLTDGSLECVGTMESGIASVKWSSDQEVSALVTGDDKLVLMSRELDPFFETELNPQEFGNAELITVGWGKKETQFHGSEGKPTVADLKPKVSEPALPWDERKVHISWCEDSQYFAVSSVDPLTGSRKIRVRSRDGSLYSTNEVVSGLEDAIDWRPMGNLIASTQRKPNKHDVIFFEKNGLRHGEFSLPFKPKEIKVVKLCWNKSSHILAIWLEKLKNDESEMKPTPFSTIQLWTRNNYHWYLKQEYQFSSVGLHVSEMLWDMEYPLRLHIVCNDGILRQINFKWAVVQSKESCIAVIDGSSLLLTPFAVAVVPPPMSLFNVAFEAAINHVCFSTCPGRLILGLSDGSFHSLTINMNHTESKPDIERLQISRDSSLEEELHLSCLGFTHFTSWTDNSYLAVCKTKADKDSICYIEGKDAGGCDLVVKSIMQVHKRVIAIATNSDTVAVEFTDGSLFCCDKENESISVKPWLTPSGTALRFPFPCHFLAVTKVNHEDIVFGMTDHYRLYVNEQQVADNCTSFAIHDDYLVFTTHTHVLRCIRLDSLVKFANSNSKDTLLNEVFSRSLERGSKIISAVCKNTKVVLQMPRGNLETIHPRALVMSYLKRLLNKCQYKDAVALMKRHRINLNLIHDHNPELFLENASKFIESVNSENDINLFLADLQEENVTATIYQSCYLEQSSKSEIFGRKVDRICSTLRNTIQSIDSKRFFLSLLTSYARQSSPDLETVLMLIKSLKDGKAEANVTSERALKHILYLTDVNELFDVALGLYDFDIVLMVAEKSNKDPKEYLPFLNELKSYEMNYSKFKIDCHLKKYRKALRHLYACGQSHFDECLNFILSHELFKDALSLAQNEPENYKRISLSYGSYLMKNRSYNEAGIIFARVECHDEAREAFVKCHSWRLAMSEAIQLGHSEDDLVVFAKSLADSLKELKRWEDVGRILELYTKDYESSILAYLDGNLWQDALQMIHRTKRLDLVETNLKPALLESYHHNHEIICKSKENFLRHKDRLSVVRAFKEKEAHELSEGLLDEPGNDLYSETSSVTGQSVISSSSKGSRTSGHSSKSRRKYQRKKYSLKEGSKFEDFALLEALAGIVNSSNQMQGEIGSLLQMLMLFAFNEEAHNLQNTFDDLLSLIKGNIAEIWTYNSEAKTARFETPPQSNVNSTFRNMDVIGRNNSEQHSGLPELIKPQLCDNVIWKLQNLL